MREMRFADGVIRRYVENSVTGGAPLKRVQFRLRTREIDFGTDVKAFDAIIKTEFRVRGRNARQIEIQIRQLRANIIGVEKDVKIFVYIRVETKFRAVVAAFALRISEHRQIVFDIDLPVAVFITISEIDVIVNAVIKDVKLSAEFIRLMPQTEIQPVRAFGTQVLIADFKCHRPNVRTKVVKLFERRRAERVRVIGNERAAFPEPDANAGRARKSGKFTVEILRVFRVVSVSFDAPAKLKRDALIFQFFQTVNRERIVPDVTLYKAFFTDRFVITRKAVEAETSRQFADRFLFKKSAIGISVIGKSRADRFAFELVVLVATDVEGKFSARDE